MTLVCVLEPRLDHAERDERAEPFNDLLLGVRSQQRPQAPAPADLLENSPVRDRQARVLILQRCRACFGTSKGAHARLLVLIHESGHILTGMVRQSNRIEKALYGGINQFYVALHGHLSVSPEHSPRLSGMALQTLHPAK